MTQEEHRIWLIQSLLRERGEAAEIPQGEQGQKRLLRALFNVRMPHSVSQEFLQVQDEYLQEVIRSKGITDYTSLQPVEDGIYLWQGDITRLKCGAIVNAANSQMLGCFMPGHACIDNAIHTFAGVQLRLECADIMGRQGHDEPTGKAKITSAYNLPCGFILHTVGPIVNGAVTERDQQLLTDCYRSCLELAEQNHIKSIAFCCISTGIFSFPNRLAAEIAVCTVKEYKAENDSKIEVIFNVFKDSDYQIYRELLCGDRTAEGRSRQG